MRDVDEAPRVQHSAGIGKVVGVEVGDGETSRVGSIDVDHLRLLYELHSPDLHAYFARRVGTDLADDLLAETFKAVIDSYETFNPDRGEVRGWLFGIGSNLLQRHWRTEQRRLRALARSAATVPTSIDPLLSLGDVAARLDARAEVERVLDAFERLAPDDRTMLILAGWEQLNSSEIGSALGLSPSTVRSQLRRARDRLRRAAALDGDESEEP